MSLDVLSRSVDDTVAVGKAIGQTATGHQVIALIGELGAGKTHLIKGIAIGLDVAEPNAVSSPTFTLINEHAGRLDLYHIDAYRLDDARQLEALGFDECCRDGALAVVEWADRVWPLVAEYTPIEIRLEHRGPTERLLRLANLPDGTREAVTALALPEPGPPS